MPHLEIRLLGTPQVRMSGEQLTSLHSDKVRGLLAYLAMEGDQPHRREKLAGLLWSGYPEESARASLRRALADLREALRPAIGDETVEPPYLDITRQTIQFERDSDAWVDATAFNEKVRATQAVNEQTIAAWEEAVALYRGEFMEGFSLPDSPEYEQWLLRNREQLKRQVLETLGRLVDCLEERGEYQRGLDHAWRGVELDPLRESAQRGLMRLLALSGQREAALAQYEVCAHVLAKELGVEPSPETQRLYEQILKGEWSNVEYAEASPTTRRPRSIGASPYRGLAAFREQDSAYFFGREQFTLQLLEAIRTRRGAAVIIGSSGSGKSSVVYAGTIPRLRSEGDWLVVNLRPGTSPFHSLSAALLPLLEPEQSETDRLIDSQKLSAAFSDGSLSLHRLLARVLDKYYGKPNLLLFIDQFEELYTLCPELDVRERFLDALLDIVEKGIGYQKPPCALLLTLRADFMGQALSYRPFADALQRGSHMLGPMTQVELRLAIEKPAEAQGAAFEPGLVDRILEDVGSEPGNLPLLEFALTLLWDEAESGWLTHAGYERIGAVHGALANFAERVYSELDEETREKAWQVFSQLVHPGEGTVDTRRVATRLEIGEGNWSLVQHLADQRLVVTGLDGSGKEIVEVVHEALIGNWGRLRGWIEADRAFRTWQERLRSAIRQWLASDRDEGALLRGAPLAEAEGWLAEKENYLSQLEQEFIRASLYQREYRRMQQERSRRRVIAGLGAGLVITLLLAIFAGGQWRSAQQAQRSAEAERDQTRVALSRSLASQSKLLLDEDLDLASLLSVEAVLIDPSAEAKSSLLATLTYKPNLINMFHEHQEELRAVALSPDGRYLATGDSAGSLYLRKFSNAESQPLGYQLWQLTGHTDSISSLVFSPDGRWLASGGYDDQIYLWDVASGERVYGPLSGQQGNLWALAFSLDGLTLISAGADGRVLLWEVGSSTPISRSLAVETGIISSLAVSSDGTILAIGTGEGRIHIWGMDDFTPLGQPLAGHDRLVRSLAFSPDSRMLASGGDDKQIVLWDMDHASATYDKQIGTPLSGHDGWVTSLAFNANGDALTSVDENGYVISWNLASDGLLPQFIFEGSGSVWSFTDSPVAGRLISSGEQGEAILWDLSQIHPLGRSIGRHLNFLTNIVFSPDGKLLASSDDEGIIALRDPANGQLLLPAWQADPYGVEAMDFSPNGEILATAGVNDQIRLWDANPDSEHFGEELITPLSAHVGDVFALAFSPQGKMMASVGADRTIKVWDMDKESDTFGKSIGMINTEHTSWIHDVFFNRTGDRLVSISANQATLWHISSNRPEDTTILELPIRLEYHSSTLAYHSELALTKSEILVVGTRNLISFMNLSLGSDEFGQIVVGPIEYSGDRIASLDVSPDSLMLAVGDLSGSLQFWDLADLQPFEPALSGHPTILGSLRFSPDGASLVSGDGNGNLILWNLDLGYWIDQACRRANRNLTQEEWRRYFGEEPYRATCPDLPAEPAQ